MVMLKGSLGARTTFDIVTDEIFPPTATKRYFVVAGISFVVLLCSFLMVFNQQLQMRQSLADANARMDAYVANNDKLVSSDQMRLKVSEGTLLSSSSRSASR